MITITMYLTVAISVIIASLFIYFLIKPNKRNVISAPSILTSIGIFGTFLGIAIGLMHFDPNDVIKGVPLFLSGIKLAFWSSVIGIFAALLHRVRFSIYPLADDSVSDTDADTEALDSLNKMKNSLTELESSMGNIEGLVSSGVQSFGTSLETLNTLAGESTVEHNFKELIDNLNTLSDSVQAGLQTVSGSFTQSLGEMVSDVTEQTHKLAEELKADDSVVTLLRELREELVNTSDLEQSILKEQIQRLLDELKEAAITGEQQSNGLLDVFASLKEQIEHGSELNREVSKQQLKADDSIATLLRELSEQLVKNSEKEQAILKEQIQRLLEGLKEETLAGEQQSDGLLDVFTGLKEQIEHGAKLSREASKQQLEELFSGLSRAATGTLSEISDLAENFINQEKWQSGNLADQIATSNSASTKSMLLMLKEILTSTEDSNHKITAELSKLRTDIAADVKHTTEQSKALVEQLHSMTESYKASLISTTTELKAQISKDMKSSYNLIDKYTRDITQMSSSNQLESLERMEAIANIMQSVVTSSADMSTLLHENAQAMSEMQESFIGTNEGSLGRFMLNMNEDLIRQLNSLEEALTAQGSLGQLMQELNNDTLKEFKSLEKAYEGSVYEIKQLPRAFAKGLKKENWKKEN